jgi:molybdenum cofactor cytidylyltransferase
VVDALKEFRVTTVNNPAYAQSEMLSSLQIGLEKVPDDIDGVLVCLGDQPQIQTAVIKGVIDMFVSTKAHHLVVPSYKMHRGHPWLVARNLWSDIQRMQAGDTLRQFLSNHQDDIAYLEVDTPSILKDLDTPQDYEEEYPTSLTEGIDLYDDDCCA